MMAPPPHLGLNADFGTGAPGDYVFQPSGEVYQVQADGSWKKLEKELAEMVRKEKGK